MVMSLSETLLKEHSGEMLILALFLIVVITLFVIVPQLIRAHLQKVELLHQEHMKAMEKDLPLPSEDERARLAGRMALLVPMVVVITAGTVTCFLSANRTDSVFTVSLAVWVVAGLVGLAAITGGVALIGRLAHLDLIREDEGAEEPAHEDHPEHPHP